MKKLLQVAVALLVVGAVAAADDAKTDLKKLEGTWQMVTHTSNGKSAPAEKLKKMTVTISGNEWSIKQDGKELLKGTVKLDPSKSPKAADWTMKSKDDTESKVLGIYEVNKDTFKHCYAAKKRPTKFESKEDSGVTYVVFKRVKK